MSSVSHDLFLELIREGVILQTWHHWPSFKLHFLFIFKKIFHSQNPHWAVYCGKLGSVNHPPQKTINFIQLKHSMDWAWHFHEITPWLPIIYELSPILPSAPSSPCPPSKSGGWYHAFKLLTGFYWVWFVSKFVWTLNISTYPKLWTIKPFIFFWQAEGTWADYPGGSSAWSLGQNRVPGAETHGLEPWICQWFPVTPRPQFPTRRCRWVIFEVPFSPHTFYSLEMLLGVLLLLKCS